MNLLVFNIGSSTVKYAIFSKCSPSGRILPTLELKFRGIIENIKNKKGYVNAIDEVFNLIKQKNITIDVIVHRVVHGGPIREPRYIDNKVLSIIKKYSEFAPLHNIPELIGIEQCKKIFDVKQIAVFDTAFFSNIPKKAYIYGLPYRYYSKYGIRRYGFHGISHKYVALKSAEILNKPLKKLKLITCHLGNGCSISAIKSGICIDTSMGFTPLEGLVMGTRAGDIDIGAVFFLMEKEKLSIKQTREILNKKSGMLGISGITNDFRELIKSKNQRAKLAMDMFAYRITKYIGAYISALNGVDAIIFTGGIGENSPKIRADVLSNFKFLGLRLDRKSNEKNKRIITKKGSKIIAMVIKTDEEVMMAKEVISLITYS